MDKVKFVKIHNRSWKKIRHLTFAHILKITLIFRVHSKYHGAVRPKIGAPSMFPISLERDFALFLKHCDLLRVPRTKTDLKTDIHHYVNYYKLDFAKLTHDGPGKLQSSLNLNLFFL